MPPSSATVSAPPDFSTEKCAGPQMRISPPSTSLMRACPAFTRTSLPLRKTVRTCPCTTSTLIGPSMEMESPSMAPTESPSGGLSPCTSSGNARPAHAKTPAQRILPILRAISLRLGPFIKADRSELRNIAATLLYYRKMATPENGKEEAPEAISPHYDIRLPKLPWHRRIQIPIIAALVFSVIRTVGPTLRFETVGGAQFQAFWAAKKPSIWAFWHRVILPI